MTKTTIGNWFAASIPDPFFLFISFFFSRQNVSIYSFATKTQRQYCKDRSRQQKTFDCWPSACIYEIAYDFVSPQMKKTSSQIIYKWIVRQRRKNNKNNNNSRQNNEKKKKKQRKQAHTEIKIQFSDFKIVFTGNNSNATKPCGIFIVF